MATAAQRKELGRLMDMLVAHEPTVHYAQARPMKTSSIRNAAQLEKALPHGVTMDCSESVTLLCRLAGLHDPNGLQYDGSGYTGTLLGHLPHYHDPSRARVGALVVFGAGNGEHVCMVRHAGKDPILFSHGAEAGPKYLKLSQIAPYMQKPVTFLSIAIL